MTEQLHFHFSLKLSKCISYSRRCVPNSTGHVCTQNKCTEVFLVALLVIALRWKGFQCPSAIDWDKSNIVMSVPKETQP